ncbi:MAG: NAD-dependent DNA ligase LigA [Bacteroidales bacterium]|nr:NAD-dependent DNA ligase LigA [Bacteroidales bacterium]
MDLFSPEPAWAKARIAELTEKLNAANHAYYVLDNPQMSDYEFDMLLAELAGLEREFPDYVQAHSPTQRVGGAPVRNFVTVLHERPMLSLGNTYTKMDLLEFDARIRRMTEEPYTYVCELKYDGVSISLIYEDGELVRAVTRGDGRQGDDVTANIRTISSIPLKLRGTGIPSRLEIRGEVIMPHKVFHALNAKREEEGEPPFANPRNAASGSLKLLDPRQTAARKLDCFLYFLLADEYDGDTHIHSLEKAAEWGFKTGAYYRECAGIDEVMAFIDEWDKKRFDLPFDIDGVVLKVNQKHLWPVLGETVKSPRWAIAFKFKAQQVRTRLSGIGFQVGRTGAVTPVAHLEPVVLAGTVVKRASLYNADNLEKMDFRQGDTVLVEKGGEIIPKIVGIDLTRREPGGAPYRFAETCPECGATLVRKEGEAGYYCPNEDRCPPQIKGRLEHFISRRAMDINTIGESKIDVLYERGLLKTIADFYDLNYEALYGVEGGEQAVTGNRRVVSLRDRSVRNILSGIEASKRKPFETVLFALGIRFVGEVTAKALARHFGDIDTLMQATKEELLQTEDVGEIIAQSVLDYFAKPEHQAIIARLKAAGLQFATARTNESRAGIFAGTVWAVSGVFSRSRDEMKELIEANGGKITSGVSRNTDFLLAGDNMGPEKRKKALALGVEMVEESRFFEWLEAGEPVGGAADGAADTPSAADAAPSGV